VGMNPREREARGKAAVAVVTACYVDLDLTDGESQETALAAVTDGDAPLPSFVVNSGYGLHVVYLLRVPSQDKATWTRTQKALARRYSALGADPKVAGDESRVLRLVPYPNRKMSPDGVPTSIVYESEYRYELAELARALAPEQGTPFSRREVVAFTPPAFHIEEPEDSPAAEGLIAVASSRHRRQSTGEAVSAHARSRIDQRVSTVTR